MLCSKDTPQDALLYLWYHFQLHRAVTTIALCEKEIKKARTGMPHYSTFEQHTIDDIMLNIQNKLRNKKITPKT